MDPRVLNPQYHQRVHKPKEIITIAKPIVLPTKVINEGTSNYSYQTNQYTTYSTSTHSKQVSNAPYQTYTTPTPVYYNYTQNNNNNNYDYLAGIERQTYKNVNNIKIAENYGIYDQNTNLQVQKRPSAGMMQNYKNMNMNINTNLDLKTFTHSDPVIHQQERKIITYTQPTETITTNVDNYFRNSNLNNYNNFYYDEKNKRKYFYEDNNNGMYMVQLGNNGNNYQNVQKMNQQKITSTPKTNNMNIPQMNQPKIVIPTNNQIPTQQYNQNVKQQKNINNINNNIYYLNQPPQQAKQIITPNQTKNIIPNTNIPPNYNHQVHHYNQNQINNNMLLNNQANIQKINNQVNNINNIPKKNNITQTNQINNNNFQNMNIAGYPQQKVIQPQMKKAAPNPVVNIKKQQLLEEPPDNLRNRERNTNRDYFNNTMPNLQAYNNEMNIPSPETNKSNMKNNQPTQPFVMKSLDYINNKINKIKKVNFYNRAQKINELSFISKKKSSNNKIINPKAINQNIINNRNNQNIGNYQNNAQIQNNNINIAKNKKQENVEYIDQYGNILVMVDGKLIDKRLLINNNNKNIINNMKQIEQPNTNNIINNINLIQNNYTNNVNNINQNTNDIFANTYPLPGQNTYSTQTLLNNNIDTNITTNNNYQSQNYSQRSNRFLEDQNYMNANINNYMNQNQQNDLFNDAEIDKFLKKANSGQIQNQENQILEIPKQKPKRRPVFKIPPSKKRAISQGRSLAFIHKYYDENFILEEENEDNGSDNENRKSKKQFKNAVREVMNIRRLIPKHKNEEENNIGEQDNNQLNNEELKNSSNNNEIKPKEESKENKESIDNKENIENEENLENKENREVENNNMMRLSHIGFSLERSSFIPDKENNNNENNNNSNEKINEKYNFDELNIDKNIYEEKKVDLNNNENSQIPKKKIKRNIDMNIDEDENDDNINIDKINEEINKKLKIYTDKEKHSSEISENNNNIEQTINKQSLSGDIPNPYAQNQLEKENDLKNSKSAEMQKEKINKNISDTKDTKLDSITNNPSYLTNEKIINNNSSIGPNFLRDSDISNINPKFYEPMKDSIMNMGQENMENNNEEGDNRISMNIEGHDLDKYFSNENENNNIIKKEIESSLRTLKSQGEDRNSQQIVDNLDEMENNNDKNNKMEQRKSGEIINNEKLITVKDIITGNKVENGNSNDLNNNNN